MEKKCIKLLLSFTSILLGIHAYAQQSNPAEWLRQFNDAQKHTVVLNNANELLPLVNINQKIACINLGFNHSVVFDSLANKYQQIPSLNGNFYATTSSLDALLDDVKFYHTLILELSDVVIFDDRVLRFIKEVEKNKQVIIALFGDARSLTKLENVQSPIVWCENHTEIGASVVAQAIFGGLSISNYLRQDYGEKLCSGSGFTIKKTRLSYTVPEAVGINSTDLAPIEAIAYEAIFAKATPSAVVLVAKNGQVIYERAFGKPSYESSRATRTNDIYDLASITKTVATTPAVMRLVENDKLSLDSPLSAYIGRTRGLNKAGIKVREVMLHEAGFTPYIPFYQKLKPSDTSSVSSDEFPTKVSDHLFLKANYFADTMWPQMLRSPLLSRGRYVYSDLSMYVMKEVVETLSEQPLNDYVAQQFYEPLGMQTAGYLPKNRFEVDRIIPTEKDSYFRKSTLQGDVHDQGAAMLGGISGHAGVFATANDLAIFYQLLLNKGTYGGKRYFKASTVEQFTTRQSSTSRRGLGFDRWDPNAIPPYPSASATPETFGHTGYTGTCVWADAKNDLIYIFLSNRVYPEVSDKLSNLRIRPRIQDVIYKALANSNTSRQ
ncbi:MAG: serine hydrolase domain-containing protein [Sphingobacteriaceae bacterium]